MHTWVILHGISGEPGVYLSVTRVHGDGGKGNKCKEGKKNMIQSKESKY